jgi:hypothetical protein
MLEAQRQLVISFGGAEGSPGRSISESPTIRFYTSTKCCVIDVLSVSFDSQTNPPGMVWSGWINGDNDYDPRVDRNIVECESCSPRLEGHKSWTVLWAWITALRMCVAKSKGRVGAFNMAGPYGSG